ncbi:MAG: polyphosphate polymerase domain-containing protein [Bacteroidales bacterium]|nr:polyphosphate polymerase domain-containing protein [Bacteroidales bacterium]MBO7479272.1 polyphosphate polymerase domain-containing protein [Bacteroidales bacterium]
MNNARTILEPLAGSIPSVSLEEMDSVRLLNRTDTKYVTDETTLVSLLEDARAAGYRALETSGSKLSPYTTVYYDTDGLKMYLAHHDKRLVRQKVRTRIYENSGEAYLEIKRKDNHGRTRKKRTRIPCDELLGFGGDGDACDYLARHSAFTADMLQPVLSTSFARITLVNAAMTERLTIDTGVHFSNYRTGLGGSLKDAVIIELKQDGRYASQMKGILLDHRVKPLRVSKYCIAETLTDPSAKKNRFKEKVRSIEKIINDKIEVI